MTNSGLTGPWKRTDAGAGMHEAWVEQPDPPGLRGHRMGRREAVCAVSNQPPLWERLPGFFLLRVAEPRSRLTRWPRPGVGELMPGSGAGAAVR